MDAFSTISGLLIAAMNLTSEVLKVRKAPRDNAEPDDRES